MTNNTEFYDRILNGTYTSEDVEKFENLCADYSDMYKDIHGFRRCGKYHIGVIRQGF